MLNRQTSQKQHLRLPPLPVLRLPPRKLLLPRLRRLQSQRRHPIAVSCGAAPSASTIALQSNIPRIGSLARFLTPVAFSSQTRTRRINSLHLRSWVQLPHLPAIWWRTTYKLTLRHSPTIHNPQLHQPPPLAERPGSRL